MRFRPGKMMLGIAKKYIFLIIWGTCLMLFSSYAWNQEAVQWKLRVSADKAAIHLQPDLKSPVIGTVPQGTILSSNQGEGAWFRIALPPDKEGIVILGYIATNDVEILEEKIQKQPDVLGAEPEEFRGIRISLKVTAGWHYFSGGDIDKGARGLFDLNADLISSSGYTEERRKPKPFHSGIEASGDLVYQLNTRIGIGLGASYDSASAESLFTFYGKDMVVFKMWSTPWINMLSFRLGLFYALPVARWLTVSLSGGPALYFVKYKYNRNIQYSTMEEDYYQQAKATKLGIQGGLGLEIHLNQRVAFLIEAQGRYVKFTDLRGSENSEGLWFIPTSPTEKVGSLYYIEGEGYPQLAVLTDDSAANSNARKAVLDFTGVSFKAGFRFRF